MFIDALNVIISDPMFVKIIIAIVGVIVINYLSAFIKKSVLTSVKDNETRYRVRKIITFATYFVILIFAMIVFYERLRTLTIAFGVVGAGIAFALQEVIASVAGWIALSTQNYYQIGDRIQLGGIRGDVIDISLLRTTLMELGEWVDADLYTGRIVRISNSFVFKSPVYNYSADFPFLWDQLKIPIKYGADVDFTKQMLLDIANSIVKQDTANSKHQWDNMIKKYLVEKAGLEPLVTIVANDNWMEFTLRYIVDYKKRLTTKSKIFETIVKTVNQNADKISFASSTFSLVHAPEIKVNLSAKDAE